MKKFLIRTLVFVALATIVMTVLDLCLTTQLRQRHVGPYSCWTDIFHSRINADIVVLGNSRAWAHFSPAILDSTLHTHCYNLGHDGSAFNRQYTRYLLYREHNPKPRIILQNIDLATLDFASGYDQYQYFPYFNDADVRRWILPYEHFSLADKFLPFYRYANYGLQNLYKDVSPSVQGYCGRDYVWDVDTLTLDIDVKSPFDTDPRTMSLFDKFLADATAEGIQVILVHSPIHSYLTRRQGDLDKMWNTYQQYADKYNLTILDYTNDTLCDNTKYFYNIMHLNRKGAEIFSRHLAEDLKSMGIGN